MLLLKLAKQLAAKETTEHKKMGETINGIPVSHDKCYERACIRRSPDGSCAVAAISCGRNGKKPKHTGHLSKKEALAHVKKSMDKMPLNPFSDVKTAVVQVDPDSIVVEEIPAENDF